MQRVLDIDLDFFMYEVADGRTRDDDRLDHEEFPPWTLDETISFLSGRCGLRQKRPGIVTEHHGELFFRWRDAIDRGLLRVPFHVTHVDAHADLGMGDAGFVDLLSDLVFRDVADRRDPGPALLDGNLLAFAVGNRWIGELDFVYNRPDTGRGPDDVPGILMQGNATHADNIQLRALSQTA